MSKSKIYTISTIIPLQSVIVDSYYFHQFIDNLSSKYEIVIEHDSFSGLVSKSKYECDYYFAVEKNSISPSKLHVGTISEVE